MLTSNKFYVDESEITSDIVTGFAIEEMSGMWLPCESYRVLLISLTSQPQPFALSRQPGKIFHAQSPIETRFKSDSMYTVPHHVRYLTRELIEGGAISVVNFACATQVLSRLSRLQAM